MTQMETNVFKPTNIQIGAIVVAVVGIVVGLVGAADDADHFWQIYLLSFLFWLNLSLGCLGLLLLSSVFDARWAFAVRRVAGAGARTIPLLAIVSLPLLIAQDQVFPWAADGVELEDGKEIYLAQGFFALRTIFYFIVWTALAFGITWLSKMNDEEPDEMLIKRIKQISIAGIILYMLTASFAAFDWAMSLDYESFSSIFGWLVISQQALAAMAFVIFVLAFFWKEEPLATIATPKTVGDLGAMLLVSLMVWGYMNFMQYIVMWSGNIPDKVNWYVSRTSGDWEGYAIGLVIYHIIPFVLLIVPGFKRVRWGLAAIAAFLLFLRLLELYWVVMPPFNTEIVLEAWDIGLLFGFGGFWVTLFVWSLFRSPLVPQNDPALDQLLARHPEHEQYEISGTIIPQA